MPERVAKLAPCEATNRRYLHYWYSSSASVVGASMILLYRDMRALGVSEGEYGGAQDPYDQPQVFPHTPYCWANWA